jgi:hypothetical protein
MSVIINGTVCRNCWDVDWARKVEAEQKEKREADAARKAKEATEPSGSQSNIPGGSDQTSGSDGQSATILDGVLKGVAKPDPVIPAGDSTTIAAAASSAPGQSINIFV